MQTNNRNLTLTPVPGTTNVQVRVKYSAIFTPLERHLTSHGVTFRERIVVLGIDPPGGFNGTTLHVFPVQILPVIPGPAAQVIARDRTIVVSRASLNEDAGFFDSDEIRCRIELSSVPSLIHQAFTDQETLFEGIVLPTPALNG